MNPFTFTLSTTNRFFMGESSKPYEKDVQLKQSELKEKHPEQAALLQLLYGVLKGEKPTDDMVGLTYSTKNGALNSIWGPSLCMDENGQVGIYIYGEFLPLSKGKRPNDYKSKLDNCEISGQFTSSEYNGYDDVIFKVTVLKGETTIIYYEIPVRYQSTKELARGDKKGKKALIPENLSMEVWSGNSDPSDPFSIPNLINGIPSGSTIVKMACLNEGDYKVIGSEVMERNGNTSAKLILKGTQNEIGEYIQIIADPEKLPDRVDIYLEEISVWADKNALAKLQLLKPKFTEENPGTLKVTQLKESTYKGAKTWVVKSTLILPEGQVTDVAPSKKMDALDW